MLFDLAAALSLINRLLRLAALGMVLDAAWPPRYEA
jgi:hypothetical protein